MKRSLDYILRDMALMEGFLARRDVKYRRNYNRYYNNFNRTEDIHTIYGNIVSYYTMQDEQVGTIPYFNILRSCVDTISSKMSQTKVRPFFNPVLGTYKTVKTCRNAQIYFDEYYEMQDMYKKSINAFVDGLIFDMGCLWIDDETKSVKKLAPWQFIFDAGEMSIGEFTRCEIRIKQYPLIALRDVLKKDSEQYKIMEESPQAYCDYRIYYDLINKVQYKFIGTELIQTRKIDFDKPPVVWMYYKDPVKGAFSDSMVDVIYRLQKMIDDITYKISVAAELSPANIIFVPRNSDIKTSMIASAKIGDIFEYTIGPTGGNPITIATPPIIDPMYIQLLEMFEQKAYNMVGVSQLSAQSKKPSGINSGVALQTLEDVESERHNVLLGAYIRFVRDIAERMIDIFPDTEELLPKRRARSITTWGDIKKEREMFNIQYSASNSLSKDPKVKMEQIEKLIAMKIIEPSTASTLLEMPDIENAYSIATAAYDMNEKTIERVIEDGPSIDEATGIAKFYFYEGTNIQQLFAQTLNTLFRLDANDEKPEVLENLAAFVRQLKGMMDEINGALQPPPPPPGPPMPPPAAPLPPAGPVPIAPPM